MINELNYPVSLAKSVKDILAEDIWVSGDITASITDPLAFPVKFTSFTSVFITEGECIFLLNLVQYKIKAPCILNIRAGQILQKEYVSRDFRAKCMVLSDALTSNVLMILRNSGVYPISENEPILHLSADLKTKLLRFYLDIKLIVEEKDNPYVQSIVRYSIVTFFLRFILKLYTDNERVQILSHGKIVDEFFSLLKVNFKKYRFLSFYAEELSITPKHLSRTLKHHTGFSAVEWIEQYVVLEAKVLLKSTRLTVQQISEELNFPSQSFFGKYFKKCTGFSPKEFRNS